MKSRSVFALVAGLGAVLSACGGGGAGETRGTNGDSALVIAAARYDSADQSLTVSGPLFSAAHHLTRQDDNDERDARSEGSQSSSSTDEARVAVYDAQRGNLLGEAQRTEQGWSFRRERVDSVPCRVQVKMGSQSAERDVDDTVALCGGNSASGGTAVAPASNAYQLLAFNDLGMHCMDRENSTFAVLPPFNTLHAQVLQRSAGGSAAAQLLDPSRVELRYKAIADQRGSINSTSTATNAGQAKTDFWTYVLKIYGAALEPDVGLTGARMPGKENVPQPFRDFSTQHQWFTAEGIPLTPVDDSGSTNNYPLFRVEALDKRTGALLDTLDVVVPVSTDMNCNTCHLTGGVAAAPSAGISWSSAQNPELQTKENILIVHDQRHGTRLMQDKPVLCAGCHYSPALDLAGTGPTGAQVGKPFLSRAVHTRHGERGPDGLAVIPDQGIDTCYNCHPGPKTQCFRGAMFTAGLACENCHGGMLAVGGKFPRSDTNAPRLPWQELPKCQSCHIGDALDPAGGVPLRVAYDSADPSATPRLAANKRFAEPDGNLYRNSHGHGGLACSACHGSPHAIWPVENGSPARNDNVAATQIQGHAGTLIECSACHESLPLTLAGPHGLHNVGDPRWARGHEDFFERDPNACRACHGRDLEGTALSKAQADRVYSVEGRSVRIAKGTNVGCTLCHRKP